MLACRSVRPDKISSPGLKIASNTCAVALVSVTCIFGAKPVRAGGAYM